MLVTLASSRLLHMAAEPSKKTPRSVMLRIAAGFIRLPPEIYVFGLLSNSIQLVFPIAKPIKPAISVQNRPATWRNSRQTGNTGPNTVFDIGSGGLPG